MSQSGLLHNLARNPTPGLTSILAGTLLKIPTLIQAWTCVTLCSSSHLLVKLEGEGLHNIKSSPVVLLLFDTNSQTPVIHKLILRRSLNYWANSMNVLYNFTIRGATCTFEHFNVDLNNSVSARIPV